ncbi:serine hydrolase [Dyadobacter arcticus]|uniref:CubicO group peptidase (Beta-lactamase class C family) n=1 Tax=Dyadobacter arcticus TaxID=1078754 RepID=A0ABX0UR59_9BACT|nr:serine hydrolase [Dyadobacter arcticus]NIJ54210.1 CubicO group peptidase (beta-lactamase class C family) [Dyadobacter arcticus]
MKKITFPLLLFLPSLLFLILFNNQVKAQLSSKQVDSLVQKAIEKFNVAGVAVAIVKDGKVIHEKGYGVKSIETKKPVDEHTNFQIASNSKAFTAAALAILIDEGKLSWNDKVKTHIPEFKMYNEYVTENFAIADLLCHRSGLGLGVGDLMFIPDGTDFTIKDVLTNFQYFKPVSGFRTQFDYDNQLYIVAGEVIARVSGMSWGKFVETKILAPLQMNQTFTTPSAIKDKTNLATPHSTDAGPIRTIALFGDMINGAAGGILSNVNDMSKWVLMQLNKGKYGSSLEKQLFAEARQREMWKIHTVTGINRDPRYNQHFGGYGLGWNLADVKGNLRVSHTGGLPGMLSNVTMIPDFKLGVIILTNTESGGAGLFLSVNQSIIDSYLGLDKIDWLERYGKDFQARKGSADSVTIKVWQTVSAAKNTPIKSADYVGVYEDKWFGKIEIFLKGNQLWFKALRSPKLNGPMQFYKANTFAIKWEYQDMNCDAFASFSLDEEGKAQSIKMKGISPNIDFSFDFHDLDLRRVGK